MNPLLVLIVVVGLAGALASASLTSNPSIQATAKPAAPPPVVIPFELVNRHVMLRVKVNDSAPLSFVLDTGDQFAIVDLDRAKQLGLKLQGTVRIGGAGSDTSAGAFVQDASFTIPGLAGFSQPVRLALPISGLAPRLGQDFDGILGTEFIKQFVVEIDYQARQIKLHDKTAFTYSGPGERIPIKFNSGGHPIMAAEVTPTGSDPLKGNFVLDIGSGAALVLYSPFVTEHHLIGPERKTIKALGGAGAGGQTSGQIGRVAELKIGNFRIVNPVTVFSEDKAGALADPTLLGNIGQQIAGKFRIFLDYNREGIILEPNATFSESFDRASGGLSLQAEGKNYRTFRVSEVLEKSPAAEAGLLKDDIITAIDGKHAEDLTLTKVYEMFERPVPYKLTVRRGEQTLQVILTPRKLV